MLTTNKSSSELTNKIKNQTLYANYLIQRQAVSQGCLGRISIEGGSGAQKESKIWTDIKQGEAQTTLLEQTAILANNQCSVSAILPPFSIGGSMFFNYEAVSDGSSLIFSNDANLSIGTDNFTIEWFQYWETGASFPRVFSIGTFPSADIAVSYEGGIFYLWVEGAANDAGIEPPQNEWVHIALVGNGTSIKIYVNGSLQETITVSYNLSDSTTNLAIGNESSPSSVAGFTGKITNFRWVVGTQVYTGNFTVPTAPLTAIPGTQLLLLATSSENVFTDSSSQNRTSTNSGVIFSSLSPF